VQGGVGVGGWVGWVVVVMVVVIVADSASALPQRASIGRA